MRWDTFFSMLSPDQRKEAAAALRSVTEETRPAQSNKQQVVLVDAREVRESTAKMLAKMHAEEAQKQAERYAEQRNRATRGAR